MQTGFDIFWKNQYYYMNPIREDKIKGAYNKLIDYKVKTMMKHLFGGEVSVGHIPKIDTELYTKKIFQYYKERVAISSAKDETEMAQKFLNNFTDEEILTNKTLRDITIGNTKYQKGTKVYRLIRKFGRYFNLHADIENKMYGQLKLQDDKVKDIYLSVRPEHFLQATENGDSCFRVEGEHESSALIYPTLPYSMLAYTEDKSWRAFVYFNHDRKVFTIMPGYPRENFYAQVAVRHFFESKGYEIVSHFMFNHGAYQDSDTFYISPSKSRGTERIVVQEYLDRDLYSGLVIKGSDYKNIIAAYCDRCDRIEVGEYSYHDPNSDEPEVCESCYYET